MSQTSFLHEHSLLHKQKVQIHKNHRGIHVASESPVERYHVVQSIKQSYHTRVSQMVVSMRTCLDVQYLLLKSGQSTNRDFLLNFFRSTVLLLYVTEEHQNINIPYFSFHSETVDSIQYS